MTTQNKSEKSSKFYWAGAYIAFGVPFLGLELLGLLYGVSPSNAELQSNMHLIIIMLHFLGGLSGGFLINLRSSVGWQQGGIVTGVLAYVLEQIVHMALYGWDSIGDAYTMFALIGGALFGAFISEYTDVKNRLKISKDNDEDQ
jgi:hypothetical protein